MRVGEGVVAMRTVKYRFCIDHEQTIPTPAWQARALTSED